MTSKHERPGEEGHARPAPPAGRPRAKRILAYAGGAALALIAVSLVLGVLRGSLSSPPGGAPGDPSSAGVIDYDPSWSPDSRWIAFDRSDYGSPDDERSGASDVFVARADGGGLRRLTQTPHEETVLGWLSNPLRVVYSSYAPKEPTRLYALDVRGGPPVELGELRKTDQLLALSHDARRALVGAPRVSPDRYALVDLVAKTRRLLPGRGGSGMWMDGAWSRDDSLLAYVTGESIVVLRGERVFRRVPLGAHDSASGGLAWAPDGRRLAYGEGGEAGSLWLVRIEDGSRSRLTGTSETSDRNPVWSPDGSTIYYEHGSFDDRDGLRTMPPDGRGDRKITDDDWSGGGLFDSGRNDRWLDTARISPDGTKIAYLLGELGAWKNWSLVGVMNADGAGKTPFPAR